MSEKKDTRNVWKELTKEFPKEAIKEVTFGRQYTSLDAYHIISRLTSVFGLCGVGWGFGHLEFKELESSVVCIGSIWYRDPEFEDQTCQVDAVGDGTIVSSKKTGIRDVAGAYKKSQTNLMSKAASYIGVGLSIYQGKGLDDPYLDKAEVENKQQDVKVYKYDISDLPKDKLPAVNEFLKKNGAYRMDANPSQVVSFKPLKKLEKYQVVDLDSVEDINKLLEV